MDPRIKHVINKADVIVRRPILEKNVTIVRWAILEKDVTKVGITFWYLYFGIGIIKPVNTRILVLEIFLAHVASTGCLFVFDIF